VDLATDTRFFPREETINSIAQKHVRARRMAALDQQAVHSWVERQKIRDPTGDWHFRAYDKARQQRLLLVHQTKRQQRLLRLYGNNIVGLDATYKTTKWGFPLFLINVVTNHGRGFPVAMFMVQDEDQWAVTEALQMWVMRCTRAIALPHACLLPACPHCMIG
jgi:hypothetical protein